MRHVEFHSDGQIKSGRITIAGTIRAERLGGVRLHSLHAANSRILVFLLVLVFVVFAFVFALVLFFVFLLFLTLKAGT